MNVLKYRLMSSLSELERAGLRVSFLHLMHLPAEHLGL